MDANLTWTLNPYFCKMDDDTKAFLDNLYSEHDKRVVAIYCLPTSDSSIVTRSLSMKVSRDLSQAAKNHLPAPRAKTAHQQGIFLCMFSH